MMIWTQEARLRNCIFILRAGTELLRVCWLDNDASLPLFTRNLFGHQPKHYILAISHLFSTFMILFTSGY